MQRILIVNNDFETMTLLKSGLEKKHYEVLFTGNKNEIIPLTKTFEPQLILIDILHKDIICELKMVNTINHIPILLMTGYTQRGNNEITEADDTIEKPFDLSLLQQKIERLLSLGASL